MRVPRSAWVPACARRGGCEGAVKAEVCTSAAEPACTSHPHFRICSLLVFWLGFFSPLQSAERCGRGLFKEMEINKILIELQSEFDSLKISIIYNLRSRAGGNDSYLRSTSGQSCCLYNRQTGGTAGCGGEGAGGQKTQRPPCPWSPSSPAWLLSVPPALYAWALFQSVASLHPLADGGCQPRLVLLKVRGSC